MSRGLAIAASLTRLFFRHCFSTLSREDMHVHRRRESRLTFARTSSLSRHTLSAVYVSSLSCVKREEMRARFLRGETAEVAGSAIFNITLNLTHRSDVYISPV